MTDGTTVVIGPLETELTAPYWEAARRGVVALQRCPACGIFWHPPQPACPTCQETAVEWVDAEGSGVVHSFTVVHHATHPAVTGHTPYTVAVVELTEGPKFICNVLDHAAEHLAVGMPVRIALGRSPAGALLPQAFPAETVPDGVT